MEFYNTDFLIRGLKKDDYYVARDVNSHYYHNHNWQVLCEYDYDGQTEEEKDMDYHNNKKGRTCGKDFSQSCIYSCMKKLYNGELQVIDPESGEAGPPDWGNIYTVHF